MKPALLDTVQVTEHHFQTFYDHDDYGGNNSFIFDEVTKTVSFRGHVAKLTAKEFRLVKCLTERAGQLVPIEEIIKAVWRTDQWITSNTVAVHISKIRKKLRLYPEFDVLLRSEYGQGYQLLWISAYGK